MTINLRKSAIQYAKKGWPVFPLQGIENGMCQCGNSDCGRKSGKHPRTRNGFKNGTTEIETIKRKWTAYPDSNIGIATGMDSFVALDVDEQVGKKNLKLLEQKYDPLPETVTVITGNGYHLWFKSPGKYIGCSTGRIAEKLDFRGDGGYIVAPPSRHYLGGNYKFAKGKSLNDIEVAEIPDWLLNLALEASIKKKKPSERGLVK